MTWILKSRAYYSSNTIAVTRFELSVHEQLLLFYWIVFKKRIKQGKLAVVSLSL